MLRRDLLLLSLIFVGLTALIALGPGRGDSAPGGGASSHASGPGGALALYRWLGELGYAVARLEYSPFALEPADDMLVVLGPSERYSAEEAEGVRAWVEAGGMLLVADWRRGLAAPSGPLLAAFELAIVAAPEDGPALAPALQPVLGAPVVQRLDARTGAVVSAEGVAVAALAGSDVAPVLVGLQYGEGYVFAAAAVHPFTNEGLRDADSGAMVLNLLRRIAPGGRVVFDEIHHGFVGEASLRTLLLGTPWGWASVYALVVLAGYLALTGRRFGRPVPLKVEAARRSSAEYLASMAGLLRRAGKRDYVLAHYRAGLKRRLSRAYGLGPDAADRELVEAIAQTRPETARAVGELLERMAGPPGDEAALLALVRDADELMERG